MGTFVEDSAYIERLQEDIEIAVRLCSRALDKWGWGVNDNHRVIIPPAFMPGGYIVFALTFVRSSVRMFVRVFVRSLLSVTFVEFTTKFLVKVSLSEYISLTTHQKAFIFEPWLPERVSFYTMSFCPRVDAPGWG